MNKLALLIALVAVPSLSFGDDKKLEKGGTYDCAKDPAVSIGNGKGTYTFKGKCKSISVGGGMNTLTIESVDHLHVGGGMNTINVAMAEAVHIGGAKNTLKFDTVGAIDVGGADNTITWKKAKTGDKPTLKGQPDKNKITQAK
jgi:hypothetical protein